MAGYDFDWERAEPEFRQAIAHGAQAHTRSMYGLIFPTRRRFREAQAEFRMAEERLRQRADGAIAIRFSECSIEYPTSMTESDRP